MLKPSVLTVSVFEAALSPATALTHVDETLVSKSAMVDAPEVVSCTVESGDAAEYVQFTVKYLPDGLDIGPFCPAAIDDVGGFWSWDGNNAGLSRIDGAFLKMLRRAGFPVL